MGAMDTSLQDGDIIERPESIGFVPTIEQPLPSFRCTEIKADGERCKNGGITGMLPDNSKCSVHGGGQLSVKEKARARVDAARMKLLEDGTGLAADTLVSLLDSGTADNVRLKAATEILDRTGVRGGYEVDISGEVTVDTAKIVSERLTALLFDDEDDVVDGEVVEDSE